MVITTFYLTIASQNCEGQSKSKSNYPFYFFKKQASTDFRETRDLRSFLWQSLQYSYFRGLCIKSCYSLTHRLSSKHKEWPCLQSMAEFVIRLHFPIVSSFHELKTEINMFIVKILTGTSARYPPLPDITGDWSEHWSVSTGGHAVYHHVQLWRYRHSQHRGQLGVRVADQPAEPTGAHKGTARQHRWHDPPSGLDLPKVSLMEKGIKLLLLDLMLIMNLCLKGTSGRVGRWNILSNGTPLVWRRRTRSEPTWPRCCWATGRIPCKFSQLHSSS